MTPRESDCPRCGTTLTELDWWVTRVTDSGHYVEICRDCNADLESGHVDPDDWDDDDDENPPAAEVEFVPASKVQSAEVLTGP